MAQSSSVLPHDKAPLQVVHPAAFNEHRAELLGCFLLVFIVIVELQRQKGLSRELHVVEDT